MAESSVGSVSGAGSLLDARAAQVLAEAAAAPRSGRGAAARSAEGAAPVSGMGASENAKIEKSSHDFESILLGSWLQAAEQSFATVPGGDGDGDDDDAGKDQFQGIAMQALAGSMTASGGIGIAKMIAAHLRHAAEGDAVPIGRSGKLEKPDVPALKGAGLPG